MEASASRSRLAKALDKLKPLRGIKSMKGIDYVERGDFYEVVVKETFIDQRGLFGMVFRESHLKKDYILLSGVPPITVKYPKTRVDRSNLQGYKEIRYCIYKQVVQTIREAPKEVHAAYSKAYYKAVEEYAVRLKNKFPPDKDEEIEKVRNELSSLGQIKADQMIRDGQIKADQIRASHRKATPKDVGNQTGQVDPHNVNVDLATMLSAKATLEESDIEKRVSNRQALTESYAKMCIAVANDSADEYINWRKLLMASRREEYEKKYRDFRKVRSLNEALLGFKV